MLVKHIEIAFFNLYSLFDPFFILNMKFMGKRTKLDAWLKQILEKIKQIKTSALDFSKEISYIVVKMHPIHTFLSFNCARFMWHSGYYYV